MSDAAACSFEDILAIERRREALGMSKDALERLAGIARGHYRRLTAGSCNPQPRTIARLKLALQRFALKQSADTDADFALTVAYRLAVAMAAKAMDEDPRAIHRQDPGRRATHSPEWLRAAEVRRLAIYLMNTGCGFPQSDVARAAGMTRQAASLACRAIEEKREDRDFDRMLDELTAAVMGEW